MNDMLRVGTRASVAIWILAGVGLTLAAVPARAQTANGGGALAAASAIAYVEPPVDALARNMKILAANPQDFNALIAAGKAALALDDTQSAAGFFGRAQERWPASPLPLAGMGAAMVAEGDATGALRFFQRAEALGLGVLTFAADRGLAYDLLGRHTDAQADYRAALAGQDRNEARRRLALSLAVVGKKAEALAALAPLAAAGDAGAVRCRAMILAVTGDAEGAKRTIDVAMPGAGAQMGPFFRRLPTLASAQKSAAVNLGFFPGNGQPAYVGVATPTRNYSPPAAAASGSARTDPVSGNRLADIEALLSGRATSQPVLPNSTARPTIAYGPPAPTVNYGSVAPVAPPRPVQVANVSNLPVRSTTLAATEKPRVWLQLASGANAAALPVEYQRIQRRNTEMLRDISPYIAEEAGKARLLIGPFRSKSEAEIFADDLATASVSAFSWTSRPGQTIRKIATE
ncbi:MAG: hypothetical protein M3Q52_05750 [Pseudomonadota bacterium]|nr:hypothetical protein [Pseudomonadota bacterium]